MKNDFEADLIKSLNFHLKDNGIAFRLKQAEYTNQIVDILIDSTKYGYIFIEAKSMDYIKYDKLYFNGRFSDGQIEGIEEFRKKSGRKGFLFVELRQGKGNKNIVLIYKWEDIYKKYISDEKSIVFRDTDFKTNKIGEYLDLGRFFSVFV